ncbi:hypothetical protein EWB00_011391 [Schistosoma japonicum]|uniref:TOX high mobility group box family member 4 n=1 Tax=Schistosoma japonicum TaxID=6182 RepID=A0A4Z2DLJ7_SCHJA|nr:hypothetical protein EWB00_011391 [Schistosoma japonicum]
MEHVDDTQTSVAENHFHKPPSHSVKSIKAADSAAVNRGPQYDYPSNKFKVDKVHDQTSFISSNDPDLIENNTSSIIEADEDDDVPLSTFLPLKSDNLTNNTTIFTINNNNNSNHDAKNLPILCPCTKPAILDDPRWDGQFCSPECLIRVCHDAFDVWLTNHQSIIKNNSMI